MSISIHPTFQGGATSIEDIISFRQSQISSEFYQESTAPFAITLMTCHPDNHEEDVYSVFVPNGQFNGSMRNAIHGRAEQSMHQHNYFEFVYVLEGNMYQIVEGTQYFYPVGSGCLLNRDTLHTELFSSEYRAFFFTLTLDFLHTLLYQQDSFLFSEEKNLSDKLVLNFLRKNTQTDHEDIKDFLDFVPQIEETEQKFLVHDLFEKMIFTMINPYPGATFEIQKLVNQLFSILCNPNYYQGVHVSTHSSPDSLLFARINHILAAHNGRIRNHELAELLNYNGTYLGRIVKSKTNLSLFDYSMTFTMKAAAQMLTATPMKISEIMAALQFSNQTHFYKIFENYYHMTPKEYRNKNLS